MTTMASAIVEVGVESSLRTQMLKMPDLNKIEFEISQMPNLSKIEKLLNDSTYRELIESSENFNTRLCLERKSRLPFIDNHTGIAQRNSNLYMKKSQRIPGLKDGQIYTYPSQRWRKSRRQYLLTSTNYHQPYSYRPFGRFRESEFEVPVQVPIIIPTGPPPISEVMVDNSSSMGVTDQDSKDSSHNNDVPKEWFYDEIEMNEIEGFENEHEQDSEDLDYQEPYSSRRKKRGRASTGRGRGTTVATSLPETPARRGRGRGAGRSKKASQIAPPPMDTSSNSSDKFADFTRSRRGGQMPPQQPIPTGPQPPSHVMSSAHINLSQPINFEDPIPMHTLMCKGQMDKHLDEELSSSSTSQSNSSLPKSHPYAQHHKDKPKAAPSLYCDFCLGDARLNKKSNSPEELVSCSDCGRSGHPTCLQFTKNMIISVRKYRWQCIECKYCSICGTSDNDDQLLFCDDCDRGLHIYCLSPPLTQPPEGSWSCSICTEEFHANK